MAASTAHFLIGSGLFLLLGLILKIYTHNSEFARAVRAAKHGPINKGLSCPHCKVGGRVHTNEVTRKMGVSGGKATAALLTGGLSLFFVGLSRRARVIEGYCEACGITWDF